MDRVMVSVYIAVSLDGRIARNDGGLDWLAPMQIDGEDYGYAEFLAGIDNGPVLGREMYETALRFNPWPYAGRNVVVLTHREIAAQHGERTHAGALAPSAVRSVNVAQSMFTLDGGQAIRQALAEDLVDELTLSSIPIVLGDGRPLFAAGLPESKWSLQSVRGFPTGWCKAGILTRPGLNLR